MPADGLGLYVLLPALVGGEGCGAKLSGG